MLQANCKRLAVLVFRFRPLYCLLKRRHLWFNNLHVVFHLTEFFMTTWVALPSQTIRTVCTSTASFNGRCLKGWLHRNNGLRSCYSNRCRLLYSNLLVKRQYKDSTRSDLTKLYSNHWNSDQSHFMMLLCFCWAGRSSDTNLFNYLLYNC